MAKAVRPPRGVPHVCYCFTPMRYAWEGRDAYLDAWSGRPVRRALAGAMLDGLRAWDRATAARVTHFVAISETVRERIARCYGRESRVIAPPVDTDFYTPDRSRATALPLRLGAGAVQAGRARGAGLLALGPPAGRHRRGARAGAARGDGRAERPVPGLAARRGDPRPLSPLPGPALPRRGGLRDRPGRGPGLRGPGASPWAEAAWPRRSTTRSAGPTTRRPPRRLLAAIDAWEADGRPHDPALARRRAEALALPVFRERLLGYLAEVVAGQHPAHVPPAPHVPFGLARAEKRSAEVVGWQVGNRRGMPRRMAAAPNV